ncbi:hypothetical protein EG329_005680 [Mollisiaceae sp. DMI_Dod_QoI]|nr:hypothetical protein EG329_005680 [Helotiales sp. DMI_Dod_QoI]
MGRIRQCELDLESEVTLESELKHEQQRKAHNNLAVLTQNALRKHDEQNKDLSSDVKAIREAVNQEKTRHDHLEAVNWLRQGYAAPNRLRQKPEQGTCAWVPECDIWSTWAQGSYSYPMIICGPPGSGKTTIATWLSEAAGTSITMVHFFQEREYATSNAFATALLHDMIQLETVQAVPHYLIVIKQVLALSIKKKVIDVDFSQLWLIILGLLPYMPEFTLVVDGLDECNEEARTMLTPTFISLSSQHNIRLIVTFRHHPQLARAFEPYPTIQLTQTTSLNDIQLYVNAEIERNGKTLQRLRTDIVDTIMSSCTGLFIWAVVLLRCLKDAKTYDEQLVCLRNPPRSLYAFYEKLNREMMQELTPDDIIMRRDIFVLLVGIYKSVTCKELLCLLSQEMNKEMPRGSDSWIDSEATVLRLCWPLVRISDNGIVQLMHGTVKEFLTGPLPQTMSSIHITFDEVEATLATKCLVALSQETYLSKNTIAILIRQNVGSADDPEDPYFYQYAARHWYTHLIAVRRPEMSLVQLAATFLMWNAFVSWSEFIFQTSGSQGTMLEVESKLKLWRQDLSDELQKILVLDNYFSKPYRAVADAFKEDGGDNTLPYITLYQLGEYFNLAARVEEAFEVKQTVAKALVNLLGERNPLALKAQSTFAWEYLNQSRFPEAEATFRRLAQIQEEVLGSEKPDAFVSFQRQGCAELYMTKFEEADICLTRSLAGFISTIGVDSFFYLLSQMTLGQVNEYQGEIVRASLEYEHVWRYRSTMLGPDNPMAVWAHCSMVSAYRKLQRYEDAETAVEQVIDSRTRTIGARSSGTVDAIIHKAVLYLDMERYSESMELVDFILDGGLVDEDFERCVQTNHVRATVEFFMTRVGIAIEILQSLVNQSIKIGLKGRVRSLLWVRLDLATMLRKQGRGDESSILFDEIVTSVDDDSSSSWEIPQSSGELVVAEEALRLVRNRRPDKAKSVLDRNGLRWFRLEDFWILSGSPPADTAWMKEPPLEGECSNVTARE